MPGVGVGKKVGISPGADEPSVKSGGVDGSLKQLVRNEGSYHVMQVDMERLQVVLDQREISEVEGSMRGLKFGQPPQGAHCRQWDVDILGEYRRLRGAAGDHSEPNKSGANLDRTVHGLMTVGRVGLVERKYTLPYREHG